jgi:hypothetical protein
MSSTYTDNNGLVWTRSEDRLSIKCENGQVVLGNEDMSDEYLVSVAYQQPEVTKSDSERIEELEAKIAALLARLP